MLAIFKITCEQIEVPEESQRDVIKFKKKKILPITAQSQILEWVTNGVVCGHLKLDSLKRNFAK